MDLLSRIRQELLRGGHLRTPRVFVHPNNGGQALKLREMVGRGAGRARGRRCWQAARSASLQRCVPSAWYRGTAPGKTATACRAGGWQCLASRDHPLHSSLA